MDGARRREPGYPRVHDSRGRLSRSLRGRGTRPRRRLRRGLPRLAGPRRWAASPRTRSRTTSRSGAAIISSIPTGPRRLVHEPAVPARRARLIGPGADDPGRTGRPQGSGHGRRITRSMKILVLGLDCAAPELLLGYEDLPNVRRLMEVGCYGRLEERDPADHGPRLDVPGDQPGPRLARRLRVPQPAPTTPTPAWESPRRDRSPSPPSGTTSPARGSGRSSSASPQDTPRAGSTGCP